MTTLEKVALGVVAVAMATTLLLPDRQTARVITAGGNAFSGALRTAMGR